ncbi:MAG: DNA mismatch repair protein MutS [Tannerella sp.]|jgi:DNA mismatch repair protein MutS|nr:DNA mismatch repair protein MutS [Tannerella sp.]
MTRIQETPLMKQYFDIKSTHPDAILLFRVGDFYEMYGDDAVAGAAILGIVQTKHANGTAHEVAMAGFPYHALDTYLPKLVRAGRRVAICDQLEDPKFAKKIVKRGITELVTPGIFINDSLLVNKENNFLAAVHFGKSLCGLSLLDISTGEFFTTEGTVKYIDKLLNNFSPKEVLVEKKRKALFEENFDKQFPSYYLDEWVFHEETAYRRLVRQFETQTLKGMGISELHDGIIAAGAILHYLDITKHTKIAHITLLSRIEDESFVRLDKFTVRNLELILSMNPEGVSLLDVIDDTVSPMGGRLLKRWIAFPLTDINMIRERQQAVTFFLNNAMVAEAMEALLAQIGDIERIISKIAVGRVTPREVIQLKIALQTIQPIKTVCENSADESLKRFGEYLDPCEVIMQRIQKELNPDPPALIAKCGVIANGVNDELDELRNLAFSGKNYLLKLQQREIERTGITSLKIAYNNVFGYYIEVRNAYKDKVPPEWIRKQTITSAERYITQELKEYEMKILGAEEKIQTLEQELFNALIRDVSNYASKIQNNANKIAQIDCLLSFSKTAVRSKYVCPVVDDSQVIDIKGGRHPVIEKQLPSDSPYISNDVYLDTEKQQIIIITGPNMSGKSAILRQTALITLLAQMGSFVPAQSARIGYVDKIFTRVGASDNISLGESTFMVEMTESAEIINNLSSRSLVLFDELGRGTSTYDGISIAWAIVEYIHEHPKHKAKTLFATHYHELNEMERLFKRIKNYNVSVKKIENKVIFMRKLVPGGSEHSFGIYVASMAGMPKSIVSRANEVLKQLETDNRQQGIKTKSIKKGTEGYQLNLFQLDDPVLSQMRDEIKSLDVNNLTPMEALNRLNDMKKIIIEK